MKNLIHLALLSSAIYASPILNPSERAIVGYLHNGAGWAGTPAICLHDVPNEYNVINVSFIEQVPGNPSEVQFTPDPSYVSACAKYGGMAAEVEYLKQQGRRVQISIGGQNGHIELKDEADRDRFVASTVSILKEYGFNGFDIDLEGASIGAVADGKQFENSGTPKIELFKQGVDLILQAMGPDFWLTAAPEIFYVTAAKSAYGGGGVTGAYLPFLYHFRNRINILHPQLYNSSNETIWLEGKGTLSLAQTSPDFTVWHTEALLTGFNVNNGIGPLFPALQPQQVAIGRPCKNEAASNGIPTIAEQVAALKWMTSGESYRPADAKLNLQRISGYPDLRGVMTWSVNHDAVQQYAWAKAMYGVLSTLNKPNPIPVASQVKTNDIHLQGSVIQLGQDMTGLQIFNTQGQHLFSSTQKSVDLSAFSGQLLMLRVNSEQGDFIQKYVRIP